MTTNAYHLYHHQPSPLAPEAVNYQSWLLNNGASYSVVATIEAPSPEEALLALTEKEMRHGRKRRFVTLRTANFLRETAPGDVLVGEEEAWMVLPEDHLQCITYQPSCPWKSYRPDKAVQSLCWAPSGMHLAVALQGGDVQLYSLSSNKDRFTASYRRHENWSVYVVAWSPDGTRIASGDYHGEIHVWRPDPEAGYDNAARGSILLCLAPDWHGYGEGVTSLTWAPDSRSFLSGTTAGEIKLWDADFGLVLEAFEHHQQDVTALAYAPDGRRIASASKDGTIHMWTPLNPCNQQIICQQTSPVSCFAWSPDGTLLVSASSEEGHPLRFWDASTGEPGEHIPLSVSTTSLPKVHAVSWSPDGQHLVAGCSDGTLQVFEVRQRMHILSYRSGIHARVVAAAYSPDGQWLASVQEETWGYNCRIVIWPIKADLENPSEHFPSHVEASTDE